MKKIKLYLDNCCFNRPYDDQSSIRIKIETEAKLYVQLQIKNNAYDLIVVNPVDFIKIEDGFKDESN